VVVLDCPIWSERDTRALREKFPSVLVGVAACDRSLSGFCILVTVPDKKRQAWAVVLSLVLALVGYTLWCLWRL